MPLRTAERYYAFSARLAARAAKQARRQSTLTGIASVVIAHQATQANEVSAATTAMLLEQAATSSVPRPSATISPLAFTTPQAGVEAMLSSIQRDLERQLEQDVARLTADLDNQEVERRFARLVESLVQDAGRAAQSVDITARPQVQFVRHLNLPSCSRCAVLAGRVYRYSQGFKRHPGCDCVMIPTTVANPDLTYDLAELAASGQVTGLSKADLRSLADGADFNTVVNVRSRKAGLTDAGEVLRRAGRLTPAGIYSITDSREEAVDLLRQAGYLR